MNLLRRLDKFLNSITMYRLVLYGLIILAVVALTFSVSGGLSLPAKALVASIGGLLVICYLVNKLLAFVWQAPSNTESTLITALILFMILPPATTLNRLIIIMFAGLLAVASKYILALHNKHLFNPAAIAAVIIGLMGLLHATWWIGSSVMLPFTLVFGFLIIRKIRRAYMFVAFMLASLAISVALGIHHNREIFNVIKLAFTSSPLIFLGSVMLTEPATTPPKKIHQIIYGALVGGLSVSQLHLRSVSSTPEISLIIGNIYSYILSPKHKLLLKFKHKTQLSSRVYDFSFAPSAKLSFEPGQYLEWTLPHHGTDDRGNRRTFSIASSPTEDVIRLGAKFYEPSSSFKTALSNLRPNQILTAGQLSGDFVLPKDSAQKLIFLAGGIGITPFRSMLKYLTDIGSKRDIVLFYVVSEPDEVSYAAELAAAAKIGLKLVKVLSGGEAKGWNGYTGYLTPEIISKEVPDYKDRMFYLSGPDAMVRNYKSIILKMGIGRSRVKTDYFSGY